MISQAPRLTRASQIVLGDIRPSFHHAVLYACELTEGFFVNLGSDVATSLWFRHVDNQREGVADGGECRHQFVRPGSGQLGKPCGKRATNDKTMIPTCVVTMVRLRAEPPVTLLRWSPKAALRMRRQTRNSTRIVAIYPILGGVMPHLLR
jgi:hypothetical protein